MGFGSGAWELVAGLGKDEGTGCESGELMEEFAREVAHKLVGRCAAGPA